ncbi:hypothetical protein BKH30_09485 [Actinomyces oris]|uniref:Uncharacterized protein n=1 Tax=Actinomyces oris TaxID=544580 RepID=A0A1Q8VR34_9ACTO|nr:hypothetical protein BKH30_09485 [Actinomyces oris]
MSQYPGSQYSASSAGWPANGYDPVSAGGQPSQYPPAAPFQAPQAGFSGAASQPTTARSLAAPTALAVAGLAILLIAIIGGIGSAVTRGQFNATITNLPDDQAATVELDKGSTYGLFYSDGDDAPECSVTSPDGDDVTTKSSSSSTKVKGGKLFSTFSSQKSGSYTVDCNSTAGVSVGEIIAPSSAQATLMSLFGVVGAIIMVVVGLAMGAGGMAWRSKLAAAGAAPAPAGETFGMAAGAAPGSPTVYTQGAWQSDQQPQAAQYPQQSQYQQPEPVPQQAPYAPSGAGVGTQPQYSQVAPTAQFGWTGQQQAQQPAQQQAQPAQPSVFTQPVQPGAYNPQAQPGQPGPYQQPGGWPAQ